MSDQKPQKQEQPEEALSKPVQIEEDVLKFWDDHKIFEKSLEKNKDGKSYIFYDGPPFATGLPHYGHILVSAIKDALPRYQTMRGYKVPRRWGWDCHGLPIEQLVEQKLGISGKKQIESLGVDKFNQACRDNVLKFVDEWRRTVRRIGRFVDFDNSYKTMDSTYMESVWWALKQIWDKSLIYEGRKVLLYCPRCETPVSNFEVAMDNSYDDVPEESVYVRVRLQSPLADEHTYILFWTTTPWTLPANVALAVGKDLDYVIVKPHGSEDKYIVSKNRAEVLFNNPEILKEFKGSELVGASYQPLFEIKQLISEKSFKIYDADFVSDADGSGIVHTAVVYGEDDYNLGLKVGLPIVPLLSAQGLFNELAPEFLRGKFYKETEPDIIAHLEASGQLFKKEIYTHSVPFCWRCGTRLFYNAIPAWFINIQKIKPRLRQLNQEQINWFPAHLKEGRFDKGLENAPDWNISRNRYWATALPFWKCDNKSCGRVVCIGSLQELEEKASNYKEVYASSDIREVDLHRPYVDRIKLQCGVCGNQMHRVEEVVDCWVESGSMPFAELHYPFENEEQVAQRIPAQFVTEYISQTRAWFYVMHVINTIIFDKAPFQNVLATGVIQATDGQKMSKSKGNYPDPWLIMNRYGVDALRYYLLTSPVMLAENLNFNEKELDDIYKKMTLLLYNVHSFLRMYTSATFDDSQKPVSKNILDMWILAMLHQLQIEVTRSLDNYDTARAGRPILKFINDLSTWYVRRSRDRMKEQTDANATAVKGQANEALQTLAYVLIELSKLMAPFTPFIAEFIYKDLSGKESVHLADWNELAASAPLENFELALLGNMELVRGMVELGLAARKEANLKVRQPLGYFAYKFKQEKNDAHWGDELSKIIGEELNVKEVQLSPEIAQLPDTIMKENAESAVLLSIKITPELREEGIARELERQVQDMRKKHGFKVGDLIDLYYNTSDASLEMALVNKFDRKKTFVGQVKKELEVETDYETQVEIEGKAIWLGIVKI